MRYHNVIFFIIGEALYTSKDVGNARRTYIEHMVGALPVTAAVMHRLHYPIWFPFFFFSISLPIDIRRCFTFISFLCHLFMYRLFL